MKEYFQNLNRESLLILDPDCGDGSLLYRLQKNINEVKYKIIHYLPASTICFVLILQLGAISFRRSIGVLTREEDSSLSDSFLLVAGSSLRILIFPYIHDPVHTLVNSISSGKLFYIFM